MTLDVLLWAGLIAVLGLLFGLAMIRLALAQWRAPLPAEETA